MSLCYKVTSKERGVGLAHSHSDRAAAGKISAAPRFSLLRLSAFGRLGGALALIAALWALVDWALH
jgi:hypothetical protein